MGAPIGRRDALKQLGLAGAGLAFSGGVLRGQTAPITINGKPVEIIVAAVSPITARITVMPIAGGRLPEDGALVAAAEGKTIARKREAFASVRAGDLVARYTDGPPTLHVENAKGELIQKLTFDVASPNLSFLLPKGPLLGFGEGGPQFDRKGSSDRMRNGQGGYQLRTHGGRVPVQFLVEVASPGSKCRARLLAVIRLHCVSSVK